MSLDKTGESQPKRAIRKLLELNAYSEASIKKLNQMRGLIPKKPKYTLEELLESSPEGSLAPDQESNQQVLYDFDPVDYLTDLEAISIFLADAIKTHDWSYVKKAIATAELARRKYQETGSPKQLATLTSEALEKWDAWFNSDERATDDFMSDRDKGKQ